ncbi:MAG: hypothetical protein ACREKH_11135, partial [Candidatus Rokuibacteriota bacterium]
MPRAFASLRWLVAWVLLAAPFAAQEGHPLVGTWRGSWGAANQRTDVTFVMEWDGKNATGLINPGLDAIRIQSVALDAATWTVRIEAEAKRAAGPSRIVIDAKFEDITNRRRALVGTWTEGTVKSDFR